MKHCILFWKPSNQPSNLVRQHVCQFVQKYISSSRFEFLVSNLPSVV
jgi:hypothetical protein